MDHRIEEVTDPVDGDASAPGAASSSARISVVVQNRLVVEAGPTTGRQIKEIADIPGEFALYRRSRGGNELIRDGDKIDVRNGDHFFARPAGHVR